MSLAPSSSPPDLVKYRLLEEIGHGGMATVYRALDVRLNREVAVKLMHPHLRDNHEAAARFVAEARAVAQLRHQGIVEVYDVSDEQDEERFLVAQLVRGPSLRKLLEDHQEMPPEVGACIGLLLCDALGHAHDKGIIHRDVKPENVLVELNASRKLALVKLTDFGIAKVIDAQGVTSTGQVLGSPAHMAPEQIDGGDIDARTDIFALGVLIYECMVGHLPFEGKNPAQVLRRVLDGSYADPMTERPKVGARWAAIVRRAIAQDPQDRWSEARELGAALRQELEAYGIDDPRAEVFSYLSEPEVYVESFEHRLVEMLKDKAEAARKRGNIQESAAALNRAVAFRPQDEQILQQLTTLATGMRRREMVQKAKRIGVAAVAFVVLGSGAFIFVRRTRTHSVEPAPTLAQPSEGLLTTSSVSSPAPNPLLAASSAPSASRKHGLHPPPMRKIVRAAPSGAKLEREVRITAQPGSALVSVDGSPPVRVGFGLRRTLSVGVHTLTFTTPSGDPCCKPRTRHVDVTEGEGVQRISGGVYYRKARLSLVGGPADATLECPAIGKTIKTGATVQVGMIRVEQFLTCFIAGSGIAPGPKAITLRAGRSTAVPAQ